MLESRHVKMPKASDISWLVLNSLKAPSHGLYHEISSKVNGLTLPQKWVQTITKTNLCTHVMS